MPGTTGQPGISGEPGVRGPAGPKGEKVGRPGLGEEFVAGQTEIKGPLMSDREPEPQGTRAPDSTCALLQLGVSGI